MERCVAGSTSPIWELADTARATRRPPRGCAAGGGRVPRERRKARSGHGNDGGQRRLCCRRRTGPPCSRARARRARALNVRDGGIYIDGTFGAGGYSRAILDAADTQVIAHRPRSERDRGERRSGRRRERPPDRGRGTLFRARPGGGEFGHAAGRRRRARYRRVVDATRRGRARLFVPARRAARHADGRRGPSAADVVARASERDLADIIFQLGEERHSRAVARAIVAARKAGADRKHQGARRYRRARGACAAGPDSSGDADVPGAAACS